MTWSPELYLKFGDERSRPARDLLAQVPLVSPSLVYDLGCGPGNSTALLDAAYPEAEIVGVDNSKEMLAEARRRLPSRRFVLADLTHWNAEGPSDLLFSNATFQWIPDHDAVLKRLVVTVRDGGVLAVQMPDNLEEPSHRLMHETAAAGPWSGRLADASEARSLVHSPSHYYDLLKPFCGSVEISHTIYNLPLDGAGAIVDFFRSTALRPYLGPLSENEREAFLSDYAARVAQAYPTRVDGKVLLRFPRLFLVAVR